MELKSIKESLEYYHGTFPKQALQDAVKKRETMIPVLNGFLDYALENTEKAIADDYWGHIYAAYLMAQFRETSAYPRLIRLLSFPGLVLEELLGNYDDLDAVMASVSGGDPTLIQGLIENSEADDYIRSSALQAMICLYVVGEIDRNELIEYFRSLFQSRLHKKPGPVWDTLLLCCIDIHADELFPEIEKAYEKGCVWEDFLPKHDIERAFNGDKEQDLESLFGESRYGLITDAIGEMEWWNVFNTDELETRDTFYQDPWSDLFYDPHPAGSSTHESKEMDTSDSCHCGSGLSYPHCCGKSYLS